MAAPRTIVLDKPTSARYAQLTYTSFDDGAGRGGWQVKQLVGALDAADEQALTSRIVTRFDLAPAMPDFPTPEQTAGRPARLSYAPLAAGQAAYWHTVDAGRDASGRPGNVFAHVLLDREISAPSPVRPIELWRSVGWLRPYGVSDVASAYLSGTAPPPPNPALSRSAIIDFLLAAHIDRQSVFRVMLDAVAGALADGPALILLTDDHDDAARWIAAISGLMSPAAARRFAFCTHDGPDVAAVDVESGAALVVVARARVAAYEAAGVRWEVPGAVIVDVAEQPNLGDLAGGLPHRVARGEIAVTPWSALAEGVLADEDIAEQVLTRQDEIAGELGDTGAVPAWSLAVAVTEHPELAEFAAEAHRVIATADAPGADAVGWAKELVTRAQSRYPLTVTEAVGRLTDAVARGDDTTAAARRLLHTALADPAWTEPIAALPDLASGDTGWVLADADDAAAISARCADLCRRAESAAQAEPHLVVEALAVADLVHRLCATSGPVPALRAVFDVVTADFLWDVPDLIGAGSLHTICAPAREFYLRPPVAQQPVPRLRELTALSARWLFDVPRAGGPRFEVPANPTDDDLYLFPLVVAAVLSEVTWRIPIESRRMYALDAITMALDSPRFDDETCRGLVAAVVGLQLPAVDDLNALVRAYPRRTPPSVLAELVYRGPFDDAVMRTVIDAHDVDPRLVAAATLRGWHGSGGLPPSSDWAADADTSVRGPDQSQWTDAAGDLVAMVAVGLVLAPPSGTARAVPPEFTAAVSARVAEVGGAIAELLARAARAGRFDLNWVAAQSFLRHLRQPVTPDHPPVSRAWADAVLREAVSAGTYRGPRSAVELRDATWPSVAVTTAELAESFFVTYREATPSWLTGLGLPRRSPPAG